MPAKAITVYLDFDGVLHGRKRPLFENLDAFHEIMRQFPHVQVVISSSWRETYKFDVLLDFFPEDLQTRVIGTTPVMPNLQRYDEVMQHRRGFDTDSPFLVIDDDPLQFPEDWPPLLLCDSERGLDEERRRSLTERIQTMSH